MKALIGIDSYGNLYKKIDDFNEYSSDFISNHGGLLVQENEDSSIRIKLIKIRKSNSPYYYYVKEYVFPLENHLLNNSIKIKDRSIPKIRRLCNPNLDIKEIKETKKLIKKLEQNK